jgi:hypothetical protein
MERHAYEQATREKNELIARMSKVLVTSTPPLINVFSTAYRRSHA